MALCPLSGTLIGGLAMVYHGLMKPSLSYAPHPLQPLLRQADGSRKFHPNAIVVAMMKDHGTQPLSLLKDPAYALEDRAQLAQLLGAREDELDAWGLAEALPLKRRTRPTRAKPPLQPVQPLVLDPQEVLRFKKNTLVRFLLDDCTNRRTLDLNRISMMDFPPDDFNQLAQLIGYSHSGAPSYLFTRARNAAAREWEERQQRVLMDTLQEKCDHLEQILPNVHEKAIPRTRM